MVDRQYLLYKFRFSVHEDNPSWENFRFRVVQQDALLPRPDDLDVKFLIMWHDLYSTCSEIDFQYCTAFASILGVVVLGFLTSL